MTEPPPIELIKQGFCKLNTQKYLLTPVDRHYSPGRTRGAMSIGVHPCITEQLLWGIEDIME